MKYKMRYKLIQLHDGDFLIADMQLGKETRWNEHLENCFTSAFPDNYQGIDNKRKLLFEFEILKTFEEFKEDYPEFFI